MEGVLVDSRNFGARNLFKTDSRLFRKYVNFFILLVGGVLLMSGGFDLIFSYQDQRHALAEAERSRATSAAVSIERFTEEIEQHLQVVARISQPDSIAGNSQRRANYIGLLKYAPPITEVAYIDATGKEQLRVSRIAVDLIGSETDFSGKIEFREANPQKFYFSPVYFRNNSEPYVTISIAERGVNAGVVVAEVNLKFIWDVVSEIKIGQSGHAYVVDSNGILISHPDISRVLQQTSLASLPQVKEAIMAFTQPVKQNQRDVEVSRDIQGNRVFTTSVPIKKLQWQVFVEQPLGEAFSPLYFSIVRTGILGLVGLLAAVAGSLFLARKMVAPIQALQNSVAQIAAGSLDQTIDVHSGDELEDLSKAFNLMTARLQESHASMEHKVRDLGIAYAELEQKGLELEETQEQLLRTEKLAAIGQLAGGVAHDLRNPLGAIKNAIYYLKRKLDASEEFKANPRVGQFLNIIDQEADHSNKIITDLLTFARLGALSCSAIHLGEIVENTLSSVELGAQVHVIKDFDLDLPEVSADRDQLQRVFANLILNAQEAMPEGGDLNITTRQQDEFAVIAFRDTGVGMTDEVSKSIFEPLFTTKNKGTGLGLAICQQVVAKHGGTIDVLSGEAQGTTFTIKLPLDLKSQK